MRRCHAKKRREDPEGCRAYNREKSRLRRLKNPEAVRAYARAHAQTPVGRAYYERTRGHYAELTAKYRAADPTMVKRSHVKMKYGLTWDRYQAMLAAQKGVCAICKQPETWKRKTTKVWALSVDHDHRCCAGPTSCGKCVRGLLCRRCNAVLGQVRDSSKLLLSMASFLSATDVQKYAESIGLHATAAGEKVSPIYSA